MGKLCLGCGVTEFKYGFESAKFPGYCTVHWYGGESCEEIEGERRQGQFTPLSADVICARCKEPLTGRPILMDPSDAIVTVAVCAACAIAA